MRVVLAGTSHWHADLHADAVLASGASIAGVWDENPAHATSFATRRGERALTSFDDVLSERADLVILMGHPAWLPERANQIITAGQPMMLEKPAATGTAPLRAIREHARRVGAFVTVPLPNRFGPAMVRHRALRDVGRAGPLAHANFRLINGPPSRYVQDGVPWMVDPGVVGGGALRNLGLHGVDSALSLAEGELSLIASTVTTRIHREVEVEDYALLTLRDATGAVMTVETGYTFASRRPGGDFEWRVVTANATLIDYGESATCWTLDDGARTTLPREPTATRYRLCLRDTLDRLATGQAPAIDLGDYVSAMELIDQGYEKGRT